MTWSYFDISNAGLSFYKDIWDVQYYDVSCSAKCCIHRWVFIKCVWQMGLNLLGFRGVGVINAVTEKIFMLHYISPSIQYQWIFWSVGISLHRIHTTMIEWIAIPLITNYVRSFKKRSWSYRLQNAHYFRSRWDELNTLKPRKKMIANSQTLPNAFS